MIVLKFLENVFGGMGSPAPLFQHMWKLDYFWTFSYDCTSFDYSQKLCLLIFDYFFVGHVIVNIGVVAWKCQIVKIWSFLEERNTVTIFYFFFLIFFKQLIIFNDTMIYKILSNMCLILLNLSFSLIIV